MEEKVKKKFHLSSFQIIILGFLGVILLGALLLTFPFSSKERVWTPFNESLFTATSATCVTGLVVHDTATYWSTFGHVIILILIQIGGLGVITVASSFVLIAGKKITLAQRNTLVESISADGMGGVVRLIKFVIIATFVFEGIGMVMMLPTFIIDFGPIGIWYALFHAVSAFCNAGFDLLGTSSNMYPSLTNYASNPFINIPIMLLIIIGGLGFLTWDDMRKHKFHLKRYRLQSKIILTSTAILIVVPAIYFFIVDFSDKAFGERLLCSLFQSVTPRTAGFNTVDLTKLSDGGKFITTTLMLIGGGPGSTAGGMKVTTFAVIILNAFSTFFKKEDTEAFGRRIELGALKSAATVFLMYLFLPLTGAFIICLAEGIDFGTCLFETASAVGTVGLSLGITPSLGMLSQFVLMILMFLGRVGGLTLIYATLKPYNVNVSKLPQEKVTVG